MTRIFDISLAIILTVAFLLAAFLGSASIVSAEAASTQGVEVAQAETTQVPAEKAYKYVAQPGDSYTQFARKAVQTYGIVEKVNLSKVQIVFAETTLTQNAGSPLLAINETRSLSESSVKTAVEQAAKLSATQIAAWDVYTVGVDFNTNNVGQAK